MKKIGYITTSPAEFVIHQRFGRVRHLGRGSSVWKLPFIDRYYILPATTNSISFAADQITAENQGVEVSGFAIWKISVPEQTIMNFDFDGTDSAIGTIEGNLKDVVESAIRHQVANMTIEDVLRKRGSIILQLKEELAYIAQQWGIALETVEIKNVRIMSRQVFANMQAKFRDIVRLESETSALETEKQIAESRYTQREQLALREQEFARREAERKAEMDRLAATSLASLETLRRTQEKDATLDDFTIQVETSLAYTQKKIAQLRHQQEQDMVEREVQHARFEAQTEKKKQDLHLSELDEAMRLRRIETSNQQDRALALINSFSELKEVFQIKELNITDDTLGKLGRSLTKLITQGIKV